MSSKKTPKSSPPSPAQFNRNNSNTSSSQDNPSPEEIPDLVQELIEKLPLDKRTEPQIQEILREITVKASHTSTSIQSPYLPPEYIHAYNQAVPGLGDKIMEAMFQQQRHAMTMNERQMARLEKSDEFEREEFRSQRKERVSEINIKRIGQVFAFILCMILFYIAYYAIDQNQPWAAGAAFSAAGVMVASFFLQTVLNKKKENEKSVKE